MKRCMLALGAVAMMSLVAVASDPIWVDAANYGKPGLTGATRELAYGTIQDAITAASAGATIRVCSGVYSNGLTAVDSYGNARVYVSKDNLTFVADDKSNRPIIRGEWALSATDVTTAIGDGAARCIAIKSGIYCRIEGFVLEHGASPSSGEDKHLCYGGAVYGVSVTKPETVFVVDCEMRNCAAGLGMVIGATCIRSFVTNCYSPTGNNLSSLLRNTKLYACVVAHNTCYDVIAASTYAVNSTFADNRTARRFSRSGCFAYNSILYGTGARVAGDMTAENCSIGEEAPVMSTLFDDWRVLSGSTAETAGDAGWLSQIAVPDDCANKDFYGNPIASSGTIRAGAVQTVTTPPYGGLQFNSNQWTVNGRKVRNMAYVFPTAYPTQYHAKAEMLAGKYLILYKSGGVNLPAERDESIWLMPPLKSGLMATSVWEQASNAYWVDPKPGMGSDANSGTSDAPFETLQTAVTKAAKSAVIYCRSGTYEKGGDVAYGCSNRVSYSSSGKTLRLVAVDGPDVTFIKGAADPAALNNASLPGCGSNAMRCLCAGPGQIQGFTLVDGHSTEFRSGTESDYCRGAAVWGGDNAYVTDCVISNCVGSRWGIVRSQAFRCRFSHCRVDLSMFRMPVAFCDIDATCTNELSTSTYGDLEQGGYHVTIAGGPKGKPTMDSQAPTYPLVGSIVGQGLSIAANQNIHGCVLYDIETNSLAAGYVYADPLLVDPMCDLRVLASSPAVTAGEVPVAGGWGENYWKFASSADLEGNPIRFVDGKPMAGAHMSLVPGVVIAADLGGLNIVGGKVGANALEGEKEISLSRGTEAMRPCVGFTIDGVTNLFDELTAPYVITAASLAGGVCNVATLYTDDWYADPVNGSDDPARLGYTPKTAFLTLTNAMAHAVAGDTVHALPGTYRLGCADDGKSSPTLNRVVVKDGVALVGDNGPSETIIEGTAAPAPDQYGLGDGAIRCVSLLGTSSIRGFTLTGGHTAPHVGDEHFKAYNCGGAVIGSGYAKATVTDCVISNNVGGRAGAGRYATFVNCRILENTGVYDSAGTCDSAQFGCLFARNHGSTIIYAEYDVNGCTLASDNTNLAGTGLPTYMISSPNLGGVVRNSLILGTVINKTSEPYLDLYRSYCTGGPADERYLDGSQKATAAELALDADYRPVIGTTLGIDGANADYVAGTPLEGQEKDALGGQRVYNDKLDVGAVEADWRPRYAKDIRASHFAVDEATPGVTEVDGTRTVRVTAGETLKATLAQKRSADETYTLSFTVNDGSALTVTVNGVEHVYDTAGAKTLKVTASEAENALAFACTAGSADIGSLRANIGIVLLVR